MTKSESVTPSDARDHLTQFVEKSLTRLSELAKQVAANKDSDILVLRSQIFDNVELLIPYFKASGKIDSVAFSDGTTVHVITVGQEPAVRACVFSGGTEMPMKLIIAAEGTDAVTALRNLLKKTESMLGSYLNYRSKKTFSDRSKVDSGVAFVTPSAALTSSTATTLVNSKITNCATPTCSALAAKTQVAKLKAEDGADKKGKHVRTQSETGFFDSLTVNNQSFLETCGEPNSDGKDSAFLSSDGEIHPNRSFVNIREGPVPVEEGDEHFF